MAQAEEADSGPESTGGERRAASSSCLRHPEMNGLRYVHMAVTTGSGGCVLDTSLPADPMGRPKPQRGPTAARSRPAGF